MNSYDATNIQWIVHQPLVSAIRPGSWGDNVLMFLALCQFKCPVQRLIMSLTLSQCLNVSHPFLNWAQILPRTTRGQKRAEHCSVNTAFLAQTMLTHQAQSCRTKTNIYLYKHINLFSSNPYEKGDPAMQQAGLGPASSTAGRLALELAACSHFGLQRCCRAFEAATFPPAQEIPQCQDCPQRPSIGHSSLQWGRRDWHHQSEPLDGCCMCDCENMTTSVRDEKIALVFETVFEEQASDEGEVATWSYSHLYFATMVQQSDITEAGLLQVKWDQLQEVLAILGRRVGKDRVTKLKWVP